MAPRALEENAKALALDPDRREGDGEHLESSAASADAADDEADPGNRFYGSTIQETRGTTKAVGLVPRV